MIDIINNLIDSNNLDTKLNYKKQNYLTPNNDLILIDLITSGGSHNCILLDAGDAGKIVCIGWNKWGQSSVPNTSCNSSCVQVVAKAGSSCSLSSSGTVECWGNNEFNQLQLIRHGHLAPLVLQIVLGAMHKCIISMGGVFCNGRNENGETNIDVQRLNKRGISKNINMN